MRSGSLRDLRKRLSWKILTYPGSETISFYNRYYRSSYGTQAGAWLFDTVKSVAAANPAITVTRFTHSFNQPSIIAKIPGESANLGTLTRPFTHPGFPLSS